MEGAGNRKSVCYVISNIRAGYAAQQTRRAQQHNYLRKDEYTKAK